MVLVWPAGAGATVVFQNVGVKAGWTSIGIQHVGKVDEVAMPIFDGPTALRMEQTFEGFSGYHSEVRLHEAQGPVGSEAYYGMALYLPPNWIFHNQNVTFQQWARNFDQNRQEVIARFGEFNYRRFRLYLWGAAYEFLSGSLDCYRMIIELPVFPGEDG